MDLYQVYNIPERNIIIINCVQYCFMLDYLHDTQGEEEIFRNEKTSDYRD